MKHPGYCAVSNMFFRRPQHPFLQQWAKRGEAILETLSDPTTVLFFGSSLLGTLSSIGESVRALKLLKRLEPLARDPAMPPLFRLFWFGAGTMLCPSLNESARTQTSQGVSGHLKQPLLGYRETIRA
jgi:hypothetical protein